MRLPSGGLRTGLSRKRKADEDPTAESFPQKKRGRLLLLGDELDHKVQAYVQLSVTTVDQ